VAALLFKVLSVPSVLALDALSFAASALLLRALRTTLTGARDPTAPARGWRDLAVGLRFVWRHPTIRPMTLLSFAHSAALGDRYRGRVRGVGRRDRLAVPAASPCTRRARVLNR
jgi:hypothetical protein